MIPFNRPFLTGREPDLMGEAMAQGRLAGDGPFTERASSLLAERAGGGSALLTPSCTHALEMTAQLIDIGPGDEVIVPSFTFVSTANAFAMRGATVVFADCRPDTFNIDERQLESLITPRTKAIAVVHYGGVACEMDRILAIAGRHGLVVIEDNAHGLGGTYGDRPLGSLGAMATQSFHETKNVQCGEGGALVLNDAELIERARVIRDKGTNRSLFFRGMVDKYRWVDGGSSYLLSDLSAAFLTAQLEAFDDIQRHRHSVWASYDAALTSWTHEHGVTRQLIPSDRQHPAHLYALLLPTAADQAGLLEHLRERGIVGTFHYLPLHSSIAGERFGRTPPGGCPVTDDISSRLVRLPLYAGLGETDIDRIVEAVASYQPAASA